MFSKVLKPPSSVMNRHKIGENAETNRAEKETLFASAFSTFHLPSYKNDHVFHNSQTTEVGDKSTQKHGEKAEKNRVSICLCILLVSFAILQANDADEHCSPRSHSAPLTRKDNTF
ncbi:hypothetical protein AVEN_201697-1 [Araneus ventricosus]|uniref:Uncharacterized protein n=1 Tax=Araneus ventricosus TaxID=182803 RepID=A0A4Y2EYW7_ARAVE|nr:hypothetical protein AVEN_201697-1 [Araneus ventricosus]